ncbi:toprim domain-containing protein, partial [Clostridioides difficile]|nr:toprim domain-containing protein [Clostridioides difficile]
LKDYPHIKQIGLCLDADDPGRIAAERLRAQYEAAGYTVKLQTPPRGKDWNEYLQQRGPIRERGDLRQTVTR